jgi:TolB-like protein/DNA-binding winged helix-turn-helix (wHTH) protein/Tfp pilus assembly protein PilF
VAGTLETNGFCDFGPYRLDRTSRVLLRGNAVVPLTPKVLDTLAVLIDHRGEVVSKEELLKAIWPDTFVEEGNLAQNVSVLRKALGQDGGNTRYIETVPKRGYRFVAEVGTAETEASSPLPEAALAAAAPDVPPPARPRLGWRTAAAAGAVLFLFGSLGAWYYRQHQTGISGIRSLAVLPLKNLSGDPAQEYFVDGITEILTAEVSRALPVRVTSRTSAMRFRDTGKPLRAIAGDLNVDAVIEGSVVRSGGRLRITVQLIEASSDRHVWAETYDREITDALVLQEEVARAVAHEIRAGTMPARGNRSPVDRSAFDDYLRARYQLDQRSAESVPKAISFYQKAIAADPAYARAYAGLADSYNQLGTVMIGGRSPAESRKLAIAAATRALEMDPQLAEAHAALGYSNLYEWNWDRARAELEQAIRLNPNYASAHLWLGHYLAARSHYDEALQEVRLARDLDPLSPIIQTQVGWILGFAGRYHEAITETRKALEMEPGYQWAVWQLGGLLMSTGDLPGAIQVLEAAVERGRPASALAALGEAYGLAGRRKEAERVLNELVALSRQGYVPPHCFVTVYSGLRDREKVFEWLERSYQERSNSLAWMGTWRPIDWLRSDPRFVNLLQRIGL